MWKERKRKNFYPTHFHDTSYLFDEEQVVQVFGSADLSVLVWLDQ